MPLGMKIELIAALRAIMQSFVDRAFGDDPVQQVLQAEGKSTAKDDLASPSVVGWNPTTENQTEDLAAAFRDPATGADGRK